MTTNANDNNAALPESAEAIPSCGLNRSTQHTHQTFQQGFDIPVFCVIVE
ncbi:hypothetical protein [Delftia acidovorans]|nr:hypothetical protein [Delftia acidovorans]WAT84387.1 hypothetical protein O1V13_23570 [Delftia acidovorans]